MPYLMSTEKGYCSPSNNTVKTTLFHINSFLKKGNRRIHVAVVTLEIAMKRFPWNSRVLSAMSLLLVSNILT